MLKRVAIVAAMGVGAIVATPAIASTYSFSVVEGLTNGVGFTTTNAAPGFSGSTASASFTYTGALNFNDTQGQNGGPTGDLNSDFGFSMANVSGYGGSGTVTEGATQVANFSTLSTFLASSGSASNYQYGSWYKIDLGTLVAGTVLDITHDDGVSVYQGGTQVGTTVNGPTSKVEDVVRVGTTGDTFLYYSRQNGTPSILDVNVPEPASIAVFGLGLLGLTMMMRRRDA